LRRKKKESTDVKKVDLDKSEQYIDAGAPSKVKRAPRYGRCDAVFWNSLIKMVATASSHSRPAESRQKHEPAAENCRGVPMPSIHLIERHTVVAGSRQRQSFPIAALLYSVEFRFR
jgi:hypothetical protein